MPSQTVKDLLARNSQYIPKHEVFPDWETLEKTAKPGEGILVITCADARVFPESFLQVGDPTLPSRRFAIFRCAGGRVAEAMETVAAFETLKVVLLSAIVVIHHTDCGMTHTTEDEIRKTLLGIAPNAKSQIMATGWPIIDPQRVDDAIREDVAFLRNSPLVRKDIEIIGFMYDLKTGALRHVE